jgi:transcriptional regulator with XRE-family HTH domain
MHFHCKIALLRRLYDYTQQYLGERLCITAQGYGKLERGETLPDAQRVQQLADVYGISYNDLINEELVPVVVWQQQGMRVLFCPCNQIPANNLLPELEDIETRLVQLKNKLLFPHSG